MKKLFILMVAFSSYEATADWQLKRNRAAYPQPTSAPPQVATTNVQRVPRPLTNSEYVNKIPEHANLNQNQYKQQIIQPKINSFVQQQVLNYPPSVAEDFVRPVAYEVNSPFGNRFHPIDRKVKFHSGVDFAAPTGTRIRAARSGYVIFAGWKGGYGNAVVIRHDDRFATLYGHASALNVKNGQRIERGQVIALVGSTGKSTGPHLHFEVLDYGKPVNPLTHIKNHRFAAY